MMLFDPHHATSTPSDVVGLTRSKGDVMKYGEEGVENIVMFVIALRCVVLTIPQPTPMCCPACV